MGHFERLICGSDRTVVVMVKFLLFPAFLFCCRSALNLVILLGKNRRTAVLSSTTSSYPRSITQLDGLSGGRVYRHSPLRGGNYSDRPGMYSSLYILEASELFSWSTAAGLLAFASHQFEPVTIDLCPPHMFSFNFSFLTKRSGR